MLTIRTKIKTCLDIQVQQTFGRIKTKKDKKSNQAWQTLQFWLTFCRTLQFWLSKNPTQYIKKAHKKMLSIHIKIKTCSNISILANILPKKKEIVQKK